jgi:hypothetical protein
MKISKINFYRFHSHGDTIAIQYGGSHLAHTMATYRKINEWKNHSRDVVESVKRYYHNSFLDSQRQEGLNLFLGNYIYVKGMPMLWELSSDYYLHHLNPRNFLAHKPRDYVNWFTPKHLEARVLPDYQGVDLGTFEPTAVADEYWLEYYRPSIITTFGKTFAYKIGSRAQYVPEAHPQDTTTDPSPFVPRKIVPTESSIMADAKKYKKGGHVMIIEPTVMGDSTIGASIKTRLPRASDLSGPPGLQLSNGQPSASASNLLTTDKSQWSIKQWYVNLMDPSITEKDEYIKYVEYPSRLPLVTGLEELDTSSYSDSAAYIQRGQPRDIALSQVPDVKDLVRYQLFDDREGLFEDIDPENLADYEEFLAALEDEAPLTVLDEDGGKKRYKAYRQWLKGRSFFKLSKMDPEYRASN